MVLTQEQNDYIIGIYTILRKEKGIIPHASEIISLFEDKFKFRISLGTVLNKLKKAEFEVQERGGFNNTCLVSEEDFLSIYKECGGNLVQIVKKTGYRKTTVLGKCYKYHLKIDYPNHENDNFILQDYSLSLEEISKNIEDD